MPRIDTSLSKDLVKQTVIVVDAVNHDVDLDVVEQINVDLINL